MASTTCGRCGRLAHMPAASGLHISLDRDTNYACYEAAYKCPNCERLNVASQWIYVNNRSTGSTLSSGDADNRDWDRAEWLPSPTERRSFPDVPRHIADAATEATLCLSVGAHRAVGALARAVVEATAKDKGAEGRNLEKRIDALRDADHIRKHTQEQAHEVRYFGNDMAHGDFADAITKGEAEEVIELMAEILDEVYQSPARLAKRKAARLATDDEADAGPSVSV